MAQVSLSLQEGVVKSLIFFYVNRAVSLSRDL